MAKFRNRLVHLYGEVDDAFVYEFIASDIEDIRAFQKIIIQNMLRGHPPHVTSAEFFGRG